MEELRNLIIEQLRDAHSAERQAIQLMKRALRKASAPELRQGLEAHIEQSEHQRERLEEALQELGAKAGRRVNEALRGLAEDAQQQLAQYDKGPLLDIVIVAGQQRIEHFEIASYGTLAELAHAAGEEHAAEIVGEILEEEKRQDELLTELTREQLMPMMTEEDEGEEEEEDEEPEEEEEAPARAPGRRRA